MDIIASFYFESIMKNERTLEEIPVQIRGVVEDLMSVHTDKKG